MKHIAIILLVFIIAGYSCTKNTIKKPDDLIPQKKFTEMLADIYLVKGIKLDHRFNTDFKDLSDDDLYFSILKKYQVTDTVFINSIIYYSSFPKEYEKMHNHVINMLSEKDAELKGKAELNLGNK